MIVDSIHSWIVVGQVLEKWEPDVLYRYRTSLIGTCETEGESDGIIADIYKKNEQLMNWISASVQTPSSFIGLLVFVLSACVVVIISVLVCRMCRRRGTPTSRRAPRRGAGRDYAAQYSLLVGDAAGVKRANGSRTGLEDLDDDDEEDDTIIDRRLVAHPPGGGAKSRFVGLPPPNGSPRRPSDGEKVV